MLFSRFCLVLIVLQLLIDVYVVYDVFGLFRNTVNRKICTGIFQQKLMRSEFYSVGSRG